MCERAVYVRALSLISKRIIDYSTVSSAKLVEKIKAEPVFFSLIPTERCFDISLDSGLGFDLVSLHFGSVSRSMTSKAGRAEEGLSR